MWLQATQIFCQKRCSVNHLKLKNDIGFVAFGGNVPLGPTGRYHLHELQDKTNKKKKAHWDVSERPLSFWKSCPRPSQGQRPKSVKASTTTLLERFKHEWAEQRGYFKREKSMVNQAVETETGRAPANLCPGRISLQMCSAASRPPSAREMEWVRNNYFLLSLISKSGMQMETEETAAGAWSQGRRQATLANQSGSVGAQTNQILLWIIAAWAYYRDTTSLWWLTIN